MSDLTEVSVTSVLRSSEQDLNAYATLSSLKWKAHTTKYNLPLPREIDLSFSRGDQKTTTTPYQRYAKYRGSKVF